MARYPCISTDPWRRSVDESPPTKHITPGEVLAIIAVVAVVLAMAIWFLFIATGGPGLGTV